MMRLTILQRRKYSLLYVTNHYHMFIFLFWIMNRLFSILILLIMFLSSLKRIYWIVFVVTFIPFFLTQNMNSLYMLSIVVTITFLLSIRILWWQKPYEMIVNWNSKLLLQSVVLEWSRIWDVSQNVQWLLIINRDGRFYIDFS